MVIINLGKTCQPLRTSLTANIAEYMYDKPNQNTICINLDTQHNTFGTYKKLDVLNTFIENGIVNFDQLVSFIRDNHDSNIIIDCGVSVFSDLLNYIIQHKIILQFQQQNIEMIFLSTIAGGVNTLECIQDFHTLSKIPHIKLIVINDERMDSSMVNGKEFYETKAYKDAVNSGVVHREMHMPRLGSPQIEMIMDMAKRRVTFKDPSFYHEVPVALTSLSRYYHSLWRSLNLAFSDNIEIKVTPDEVKKLKEEKEKKRFSNTFIKFSGHKQSKDAKEVTPNSLEIKPKTINSNNTVDSDAQNTSVNPKRNQRVCTTVTKNGTIRAIYKEDK